MTENTEKLLKEALKLPPIERATIVDRLVSSLDKPDKTIDDLWRKEIEDRIDAYESGKMETVSVEEVLAKYKNK
ncbi:MAG: addiction module protein [Candidatus Scalindua sediminis]